MAATSGKSEDFQYDENENESETYLERLEQSFQANGLSYSDDKAKAVFLTIVGRKMHTLLMDLCAPLKPSEKKLTELIDALQNHFVPKTNFTAKRCKFAFRNQRDGESISEYMASLRKLAATCKFGAFLDDALRDRFVCGVKSTGLRDRMLNAAHTKDLTLALAYDMGLAYEVTKQNVQQLSQKPFKANAHAIEKSEWQKRDRNGKPCYRCAGKQHKSVDCRFKEVDCRICKKRGHIAKACRSRQEGKRDKPTKWTKHLDAAAPAVTSREEEMWEKPVVADSVSSSNAEDERSDFRLEEIPNLHKKRLVNQRSSSKRLKEHQTISRHIAQVM
ncbi:hypothetical protein LDENG_00200270 [Lucifuga dentata]|nr:hypothetical protein LDENG_00200270 [Lucifuga dentata]